jgi:hypothetical protein
MPIARCALIQKGSVVNVVLFDTDQESLWPDCSVFPLRDDDLAEPGGTYDERRGFERAPREERPSRAEEIAAELEADPELAEAVPVRREALRSAKAEAVEAKEVK